MRLIKEGGDVRFFHTISRIFVRFFERSMAANTEMSQKQIDDETDRMRNTLYKIIMETTKLKTDNSRREKENKSEKRLNI